MKDFVIPKGYEKIIEVKGDLDKDGKDETVIVFNTNKKITSDFQNGFKREFFILKSINGKLKIWHKNTSVLLASETGFYPEYNSNPEFIIKNGTLKIIQSFNTNSRHTQIYENIFRFQNNDFYLIGSKNEFNDTCEFNTSDDINFSTKKVIVTREYLYDCFEENPKKQNEYFDKEFIFPFKSIPKMNTFTPGEKSYKITDFKDENFGYFGY
ncbi:hypothetical protein [Epilithonimonas sp.]|uniref:hypothetical protein n=1 Tax=Epilithonimonas sp. TaxID=2894511 RepID=UPI002FDD5DBE